MFSSLGLQLISFSLLLSAHRSGNGTFPYSGDSEASYEDSSEEDYGYAVGYGVFLTREELMRMS